MWFKYAQKSNVTYHRNYEKKPQYYTKAFYKNCTRLRRSQVGVEPLASLSSVLPWSLNLRKSDTFFITTGLLNLTPKSPHR